MTANIVGVFMVENTDHSPPVLVLLQLAPSFRKMELSKEKLSQKCNQGFSCD